MYPWIGKHDRERSLSYLRRYLVIDVDWRKRVLFGLSESSHQLILDDFKAEHPDLRPQVLGGGYIHVQPDKLTFSLYGQSRTFGRESGRTESINQVKEIVDGYSGQEYSFEEREE